MTRDETIIDFLPYVYSIALNICKVRRITDQFLVDDCKSVAAENLIISVDNFIESKEEFNLKSWLMYKTSFVVIDHLRKISGRESDKEGVINLKNLNNSSFNLSIDECLDDFKLSENIEEDIINKDLIEKIFEFAENIGYRLGKGKILRKVLLEGLSQKEVAEEENCTSSNINIMIKRLKSDIVNSKQFSDI